MMSYGQWLSSILEAAKETASREYQQETWFGKSDKVSSPGEIYCQLFDDYAFDLFFEMYSKGFTPEQMAAWSEFKQELEKYAARTPQYLDPNKVFRDPEWQTVRETAARFVTAFEQKHPGPSITGQK